MSPKSRLTNTPMARTTATTITTNDRRNKTIAASYPSLKTLTLQSFSHLAFSSSNLRLRAVTNAPL